MLHVKMVRNELKKVIHAKQYAKELQNLYMNWGKNAQNLL